MAVLVKQEEIYSAPITENGRWMMVMSEEDKERPEWDWLKRK